MNISKRHIISGLLALAVIAYIIFRPKSKPELDNYFISTQSQSNDIVKDLNLDKPSEDASYILDASKLSFPNTITVADNVKHKADPEREWIINLISTEGAPFKKEDFDKMFDYDWRSKYESTIYGFSSEENRWTYADAGDSPDIFIKLQVAVDIQDAFNEETPDYNPQKLKRYIDELEKRIKKYPTKLKIEQSETIESAISKAKKLAELSDSLLANYPFEI